MPQHLNQNRANSQAQTERSIYNRMLDYRMDPCGFMTDVLSVKREYLWDKMREVAESVRDHQLTAVGAGHSVSKTYGAGRIVPWFKTCFQPSTIITTAPSDNQVRNQLWREIRAAVASSKVPLGGNISSLLWDCRPAQSTLDGLDPEQREYWEKNFAIGFSTSPDTLSETVTKMQGWHNVWMLIILDEAGGLLPQIWRTVMDSLVVNARVKVLAIGNPTSSYGDFTDALKAGSGWNVINISVEDTPNYKENREVIPGLAGRMYAEQIAKAYGPDSQTYRIRVKGQAPDYSEASYYGSQLACARSEKRIESVPCDPNVPVHYFWDLGPMHKALWLVQFVANEIRFIEYFEDNTGQGIPVVAKSTAPSLKGYIKGDYWAGPDFFGSNAQQNNGKTLQQEWAEEGINFRAVPVHRVDVGIELARGMFKNPQVPVVCRFDRDKCRIGLKRLEAYHSKKVLKFSTPDKPVYALVPEKDGNEHCADAFRHCAVAWSMYYKQGTGNYPDDWPDEPGQKVAVAGEVEEEYEDDYDEYGEQYS